MDSILFVLLENTFKKSELNEETEFELKYYM